MHYLVGLAAEDLLLRNGLDFLMYLG